MDFEKRDDLFFREGVKHVLGNIFIDSDSGKIIDTSYNPEDELIAEAAHRVFKTAIRPDGQEVTDIFGNKIERFFTVKLISLMRKHDTSLIADFFNISNYLINEFRLTLWDHPVFIDKGKSHFIFPDTMIVLGGARQIYQMYLISHIKKKEVLVPDVELKKILDNKKTLVGFELSEEDKEEGFSLEGRYVVIVDDGALTLRSLYLAKNFLFSQGANVLGALVLFDWYEGEWPEEVSDIPIKISLAKIIIK